MMRAWFDTRRRLAKRLKGEKGFVLILALVTMVLMTLIGISLTMNMSTDVGLSRNEREAKIALQTAEAGINEAIARLRLSSVQARYIGEETTDTGYRTVNWNLDGSKDFGASKADANFQSLDGLNYEVTIRYLDETNSEGFCDSNTATSPNGSANASTLPASWTCPSDTEIVYYGRDFRIPTYVTTTSYGKEPVYKITSIGTSPAGTTRTIEAYIGASSLNTDTEYGINTNSCIDANGASNNLGTVFQGVGCGCDAQITGSCTTNKTADQVANDYNMTNYLGEDITTVIEMADEKHYCSTGTCSGAADDIPSSGSLDSVISDWGDYATDTYSRMIYVDNDGGGKDVSVNNLTGRGILIVTGNLELGGSVDWEGLIYVFGTLTLSGGGASAKNVTGGIMANSTVTTNGSVTVSYDAETLSDVARRNSSSAIILWKRM